MENIYHTVILVCKLLKSSLGGNAETDIIITLHAGEEYQERIKIYYRFWLVSKKVVCAVKENVASNDDKVLIRKYKAELEKDCRETKNS